MAHYPDLSPYEYSRARSQGDPELNIGWLSQGHSYPTCPPDDAFVDALLRCCLKPVNLFRGFHVCELCGERAANGGMLQREYQGRIINLGNGEIRVTGPDERRYVAPTLVAHYVMDHAYSPPTPFVLGAHSLARTIVALNRIQVDHIRALTIGDRFQLSLEVLTALEADSRSTWLAETIHALRAAQPALNPELHSSRRDEMRRMEALALAPPAALGEDSLIVRAVRLVSQFFIYARYGDAVADERTTELTTGVIELAHEADLGGWRPDLRPSRPGDAA